MVTAAFEPQRATSGGIGTEEDADDDKL